MKNIIFLGCMYFMSSCSPIIVKDKDKVSEIAVEEPKAFEKKVDTVYVHNVQTDTVFIENMLYKKQYDSLKVVNDTLAARLLYNKLVIKNAKYYLNITNRNPSQAKFLRGWMNRVFSE